MIDPDNRWLPDVVVFDRCPFELRELVAHSSLLDKVRFVDRSSMIGAAGIVTEIQATFLPVPMWSSGEKVLWQFIASLAGQGAVNLQELFNHTDRQLQSDIIAVFATMQRPVRA